MMRKMRLMFTCLTLSREKMILMKKCLLMIIVMKKVCSILCLSVLAWHIIILFSSWIPVNLPFLTFIWKFWFLEAAFCFLPQMMNVLNICCVVPEKKQWACLVWSQFCPTKFCSIEFELVWAKNGSKPNIHFILLKLSKFQ